jgi:hypothetical protein
VSLTTAFGTWSEGEIYLLLARTLRGKSDQATGFCAFSINVEEGGFAEDLALLCRASFDIAHRGRILNADLPGRVFQMHGALEASWCSEKNSKHVGHSHGVYGGRRRVDYLALLAEFFTAQGRFH